MFNLTPKTDALKARIPEPSAIQEMVASHGNMERQLMGIAHCVRQLHDSPISLQDNLNSWLKEFEETNKE